MKPTSKLALLLTLTLLGTVEAQEARYFRITGPVAASIQSLSLDGFLTWTNPPTAATFTIQTAPSLAAPLEWVDFVQVPVTNTVTVERLFDPNPPSGMVLIPAGSFTMGDTFNEGESDERPTHTVFVSAFNMDRYEVTKALWDEVYQWAITHGYSFDNFGEGKAVNHPVQSVNWYDVVKWCNARSEKAGRVPAYYTSAGQTTVYRTGQVDVQNDWVKWDLGYRLPTEAEWEKAARGGVGGRRFPWGDTITHSQANYYSYWEGGHPFDAYDLSPTRDFHPSYASGYLPYTSAVGSFGANGYGLYDMAGNVWDWCWDGWDSYSSRSVSDPRGPALGSRRVSRGGNWSYSAFYCRTADRYSHWPGGGIIDFGFRSVLPPGQ